MASYPHYTWTFDTIPCLLSLRAYDRLTGGDRSDAVVAAHLAWLADHATQPATGLPYSQVGARTGKSVAAPRGCELSWRLSLLADLDPNAARRLYGKYVRSFWLDRGLFAGFAEWPGGRDRTQDLDSGPIIMGIGSAATTFGIAATAAGGDNARRERLICQSARGKTLLKQLNAMDPRSAKARTLDGRIDTQSEYVTGFLFGDACLFYAVTWQRWLAEPQSREK